jgi:hypothetical protein
MMRGLTFVAGLAVSLLIAEVLASRPPRGADHRHAYARDAGGFTASHRRSAPQTR